MIERKKSWGAKKTLVNLNILFNGRNDSIKLVQWFLKPKKAATDRKGLKILTPKEILQRLPIALAQVKAGNNSDILLN